MGIELELGALLLIQLTASSLFTKFEVGTAAWKRILKWLILDGITLLLFIWISHWALLFPLLIIVLGTSVHFIICKKYGIDSIHATPRKKLYELRGWKWDE